MIAGLCQDVFNALQRESSKRFAPNGQLFAKPVKWPGYPPRHSASYINQMQERILHLKESDGVRLTLAYVNYDEVSTVQFVQDFFPFALKRAIMPLALDGLHGHVKHQAVSRYVNYLAQEANELRSRASLFSGFTQVQNITPLLLPVRNFHSPHHQVLLTTLWQGLGTTTDVKQTTTDAVARFVAQHPRVLPPNSRQTCFTDGSLYFKSPGRNRHGHFRHSSVEVHSAACLLNARSRLGGSYPHDFHYDGEPHRKLATSYPNCHGEGKSPKSTHVNIAPNDYII